MVNNGTVYKILYLYPKWSSNGKLVVFNKTFMQIYTYIYVPITYK